MTNGKIKVIIFGAGGGGKNLTMEIINRNDPFEIIAYSDNDPKLQDTVLFDRPVIHPSKISSFDYDQIIIAAMDTYNIKNQLVNDCGVKPDIINDTMFSQIGGNNARITALKNAAQIILENNIIGSVAELGVFQGEFAKHINSLFSERILYLFDTFEGFFDSDVKKEKEIGTKRMFERSYNYDGTSIELVMSKMKNPDKCIVKKGFFPETAKELEDNFAFVSLDADLYQPMLEGLKYFYPRLTKGGYIFIHDYFGDAFTGTPKAVLEYKKEKDIQIAPMGDNCSVIIVKV